MSSSDSDLKISDFSSSDDDSDYSVDFYENFDILSDMSRTLYI